MMSGHSNRPFLRGHHPPLRIAKLLERRHGSPGLVLELPRQCLRLRSHGYPPLLTQQATARRTLPPPIRRTAPAEIDIGRCSSSSRDVVLSMIRACSAKRSRRVRFVQGGRHMGSVSVRYIVDDVDAAIRLYTEHLGFVGTMHPGPGFALVSRGDLRLLLSAPAGGGGAGRDMPDGRRPEPGGWNRIQIEVEDLARMVVTLRRTGAQFRNDT